MGSWESLSVLACLNIEQAPCLCLRIEARYCIGYAKTKLFYLSRDAAVAVAAATHGVV